MFDRSKFNWKQFDAYRAMNVDHDECDNKFADGADLLFAWEQAKSQYLKDLFPDGQLIIERPIRYQKGLDEMREEMSNLVDNQREFIWHFRDRLINALDYEHKYDSDRYNCSYSEDQRKRYLALSMMTSDWFNYDSLVENTVTFNWRLRDVCGERFELSILGNTIMIQNGMKLIKTMGKIARWLGLQDEFEAFRVAQSQATNQKYISGTACLSIHPLDYATASDNDNGWSSCMSWLENGCYRMGTVEMMNSPMVLVSYIKSDKQHMTINGEEWNSKKWRAWIIVTPQVLMMNRQYPYHADSIGDIMINWVRELCREKLGWQFEDQIYHDLIAELENRDKSIRFSTNYMYNDVSDDDIGCITSDPQYLDNWHSYINFSGDAQCMWCGELIDFNNDDREEADRLGCNSHRPYICECCGQEMDEDEVVFGPNGEVYCSDCYSEHVFTCNHCGELAYTENKVALTFPQNVDVAKKFFDRMQKTEDNINDNAFHPLYSEFGDQWDDSFRQPDAMTNEICEQCAQELDVHWVAGRDTSGQWDRWPLFSRHSWISVIDVRKHTFEEVMEIMSPSLYQTHIKDKNGIVSSRGIEKYSELVKEYFKAQYDALKEALEAKVIDGEDPEVFAI